MLGAPTRCNFHRSSAVIGRAAWGTALGVRTQTIRKEVANVWQRMADFRKECEELCPADVIQLPAEIKQETPADARRGSNCCRYDRSLAAAEDSAEQARVPWRGR